MSFKLYLAAVFTNSYMRDQQKWPKLLPYEQAHFDAADPILESYHYIKSQRYVDEIRAIGRRVFLDSGAFSAFTLGKTIDIREYCEYVKKNDDIIAVDDGIKMIAGLDAIGDVKATFQNLKVMEQLGVRAIPCFHSGEDERYLEHYIQNYEYISLGGMVGASIVQLGMWLDRVWSKYLIDGSGRPRVKVHGFGITTDHIMKDYPWWSCDSSTWIQATQFGNIFMPNRGIINVSEKSTAIKIRGSHIDNMTQEASKALINEIAAQGFDYERLRTEYLGRAAYNIWAFQVRGRQIREQNEKIPVTLDYMDLF